MNIVTDIHKQIKELQDKLKKIQEECNHPLSARDYVNHGGGRTYDNPQGDYWTVHTCQLCGKKWHTDQNWKYTGDGKGLKVIT